MKYQRPAMIGGGVLAFGLVVALLIPPTKPIGGAKVDITHQQGFRPIAPIPQPAARPIANAAFTTPPPAPAPEEADRDDGDDGSVEAGGPMAGRQPIVIRPNRPSENYAYVDPDDGERAFRAGYRWAQQNGVEDRRDCRGLPAGPGVEGCRAFLRDAEDRDDADDGPPPGRW